MALREKGIKGDRVEGFNEGRGEGESLVDSNEGRGRGESFEHDGGKRGGACGVE